MVYVPEKRSRSAQRHELHLAGGLEVPPMSGGKIVELFGILHIIFPPENASTGPPLNLLQFTVDGGRTAQFPLIF